MAIRYQKIPKQKFGPMGEKLCRWCEGEIEKGTGRRTFCSPDCVHDALLRSDGKYLRQQVSIRDKGVCRECGIDTQKVAAEMKNAYQLSIDGVDVNLRLGSEVWVRYNVKRLRWNQIRYNHSATISDEERKILLIHNRLRSLAAARFRRLRDELLSKGFKITRGKLDNMWEADHITPVEHGGGACGLDNIQTLCIPCHYRKNKQAAAERAATKKTSKKK